MTCSRTSPARGPPVSLLFFLLVVRIVDCPLSAKKKERDGISIRQVRVGRAPIFFWFYQLYINYNGRESKEKKPRAFHRGPKPTPAIIAIIEQIAIANPFPIR